MAKTIKALGTDAHKTWIYIRDAEGDVWAVSRTDLTDKVIMGLARGHFDVLSDRFSISTPTNAMIGWSAFHWRSALLAEAYEAGPITLRRLPRVRFVSVMPCFRDGDFIELPPMLGMSRKSVARVSQPALDLTPEVGDACAADSGS